MNEKIFIHRAMQKLIHHLMIIIQGSTESYVLIKAAQNK